MTVLIIGANPIGLILAHQLNAHNIPVQVIDFRSSLEESNELLLLSPNTFSILKNLNLFDESLFNYRIIQGFSYQRKKNFVQSNLKDNKTFSYSLLTLKSELEKSLLASALKLNIPIEWETKPIAFIEDKLFIEKKIPQQDLGERKTVSENWIIVTEAHNNPYILDLMKVNVKSSKTINWFYSKCFSSNTLSMHHIHNIPVTSIFPKYIFPSINSFNQFYIVSPTQQISHKENNYLSQNFHFSDSSINEQTFSYIPINIPLQHKNMLFVGHISFNYYYLFPLNINLQIQATLNLSWKLILSLNKRSSKSLILTYNQEVLSSLKNASKKVKSIAKQTLFFQKWCPNYLYLKLKANNLNRNIKEHLFNKIFLQYSKTSLLRQNNKDKDWEGPQCGTIAPNYLVEKNRFLLDPIQGKKHLLLFFKENKALISALYEEYGEWIEALSICEKNIKDIYCASDNSLYIIRPDYIVGYRSKSFQIKDIVSYLIKTFKSNLISNNSAKDIKLFAAH